VPSATTAFGASRTVRRRLGSAGAARADVVERLRRRLPPESGPIELGLRDGQLARVLPSREAERLAEAVSYARGTGDWLRRIVWWGTALADVAGSGDARTRTEAGRFNLAFALFDSIVDDRAPLTPQLADALDPCRLSARLANPVSDTAALRTSVPELGPLVRLFDVALADAGHRLATAPQRVARLTDLLQLMFQSELCLTPDPVPAKVLPVVFVGELVGDDCGTARLFRRLAEFCWLWDDWLDLADDLARRRPNVFLGRHSILVGAGRLAAAKRSQAEISSRLEDSVAATLRAAAQIGEAAVEHTGSFYRELLA
jgi:hypothetical protein